MYQLRIFLVLLMFGSSLSEFRRKRQVQNCVGSQCKQDNIQVCCKTNSLLSLVLYLFRLEILPLVQASVLVEGLELLVQLQVASMALDLLEVSALGPAVDLEEDLVTNMELEDSSNNNSQFRTV